MVGPLFRVFFLIFFDVYFRLRFCSVLGAFWTPFGALLGAQSGPRSVPEASRSPQETPRRPQDRPRLQFLFENLSFRKVLKNVRKHNDFYSPSRLQIAPRWPQARPRCPKIAPRRPQDLPKTILKSFFSHRSFCLRFWSVLGPTLAPFWTSLGCPRRLKNLTQNQ